MGALPLIGLTSYRTRGQMTIYDGELAALPAQYLDTISRSGGVGILLPPQHASKEIAADVVARIDGLLVTGGADIDPARYGQQLSPQHEGFEPLRDEWEDQLLSAALEADIPLLGICRGAQMLNVHLGGTLHQHLPQVIGHDRYRKPGQSFTSEPVQITPGTLLASIVGSEDTLDAPVQHHQAIDQPAPPLVVSARGLDGVIQAVEWPEKSFCLAVQWHPEENPSDDRVVAALVRAAGGSQP